MDIISKINSKFEEDISKMNELIKSFTYGNTELIYLVSNHLISSGGKRLRPILTLICARLCGYSGDRHINLAASVEFIHTATLLHDDVVDASDLRRGVKTANGIWGNKASILVGDYLLSQAFKIMVSDGSLPILDILSSASAVIAEGEVMQLAASCDLSTNYDQYFSIIKAKTAELFAACCQIGAVVLNESSEKEMALRDFGMNLGIAFQIIDDSLDYFSKEEETGKSVGNDFTEGKITLPIIIAYEMLNEDEKITWQSFFENENNSKENFAQVLSSLEKFNISNKILDYAKKYIDTARESLNIFPDGEIKNLLLEILDFSLKRLY